MLGSHDSRSGEEGEGKIDGPSAFRTHLVRARKADSQPLTWPASWGAAWPSPIASSFHLLLFGCQDHLSRALR